MQIVKSTFDLLNSSNSLVKRSISSKFLIWTNTLHVRFAEIQRIYLRFMQMRKNWAAVCFDNVLFFLKSVEFLHSKPIHYWAD